MGCDIFYEGSLPDVRLQLRVLRSVKQLGSAKAMAKE